METKPFIALQLLGSPTSKFWYDLSMLYGREVLCPQGFRLRYVVAHPDGHWHVTDDIGELGMALSRKQMIQKVAGADLAVPHMFCHEGLTTIRTLFEDELGIPLVGSSGAVAARSQDKVETKRLAAAAGVCVAAGFVLDKQGIQELIHDLDAVHANADGTSVSIALKDKSRTQPLPCIVKPNYSDNSDGVSLVRTVDAFVPALKNAMEYNDHVIIEEYIDGRELRTALIELDGKFVMLPAIEYGVNANNPIRQATDKLKFDDEGNLLAQSDKKHVPATCPASIDTQLRAELKQMMVATHKALGCRDFSMMDFRVSAQTGKPHLLETGLFWSFSEKSMISSMLTATDHDLMEITRAIWLAAMKRST